VDTKHTTETPHRNGHAPTARAARAAQRKVAAKATRAPRRARTDRAPHIGRMIATGAFIVLGAVFVLGAASITALLAGYEPPGYKAEAKRFRRYGIAHMPDISRAVDVLEPVGRHIGRGEHWMRDRIHNATR
jgi:hypothetical protein